jgi:type II secretory pathway component PulJ
MKKINTQSGFSLVEMIIYIGIVSIILVAMSTFLITLLKLRIQNQAMAEVEGQGVQIMQTITQSIRNSSTINSPTQGTSANSTSLEVSTVENDPTLFELDNGIVKITEGVANSVALHNSLVNASSLTFQNLSRDNTSGIISIQFVLSYDNPANKGEYEYSQTFYGSASLR